MPYQTIEVRKLTPHIGAEIAGVDLSQPLGNQQFQEVHDALMENLVVFFRDQRLSHEQHKSFGGLFGDLMLHPASPNSPEGHPEILTIHADENSKHVAGEEWHSDVSCDPEPPMGSILYLTEVPPEGGDTLFASMYAAYDKLSPPIRRLVEDLTAIHDGEPVYRGRFGWKDARGRDFPRAEHPVVRTHPVTGRKALFVNRNFTPRSRGSAGSKATRSSKCCTGTARRPNSSAASAGSPIRSHSGTTARSSTTRCGTTIRSIGTASASPSKATARSIGPDR